MRVYSRVLVYKYYVHLHPCYTEHVFLLMSMTSPIILAIPLLLWKFPPHKGKPGSHHYH